MTGMRWPLLAAALAAFLAFPAIAQAVRFGGPAGGGDGKIEFGVDYRHHKPHEVSRLNWSNVPATCSVGGTSSLDWPDSKTFHVNHRGRFAGEHTFFGTYDVTIHGRFKTNKKAVGTLKIVRVSDDCTNKVDWVATRNH
jgi:hypothetical protein